MSVAELLTELRALDAHVVLDGDRLRLDAPAGTLTDRHREQLKSRKQEIVDFLRSAQALAAQQRALVPLTATGNRIPIFAVAGHNGDVFCYRALAQHLGVDQPFFGLQPPGLEEGSTPRTSVTELTEYFAEQIRAHRPYGPLSVAGFCAGGTVAFELARQLSASGAEVRNVILFGAPYATSYRQLTQLVASADYFARRSLVHARTLITMPAAERRQYLSARVDALGAEAPPQPDDPVMIRRTAVETATMDAVRAHTPQPFDGHLDLMLPCESWKGSYDAPLRWKKLARSTAEFSGPDDCDGDNMLRPEHAATFAEFVRRAQAQAAVR